MKQIIITIIQKYNQANILTNSFDMFPVKIQHNPQVIFPSSPCMVKHMPWARTMAYAYNNDDVFNFPNEKFLPL